MPLNGKLNYKTPNGIIQRDTADAYGVEAKLSFRGKNISSTKVIILIICVFVFALPFSPPCRRIQ